MQAAFQHLPHGMGGIRRLAQALFLPLGRAKEGSLFLLVGNACGSNNLALAVPCHRVLYSNGALSGGYHWGNDRQATLLSREGVKNVKQAQP